MVGNRPFGLAGVFADELREPAPFEPVPLTTCTAKVIE